MKIDRIDRTPTRAEGFAREEAGATTIYFLVLSLLMFGLLGVLIDSSRTYVAHTNMQDYIDDWVLAAANELDGQPDAIERATQVLESSLIMKTTKVGMSEEGQFEIGEVFFLSSAPDSGNTRLSYDDFREFITTDPAEATHVLVTAQQREVPWGLTRLINAASGVNQDGQAFEISTWAAATLVSDKYCVEPLVAICAPEGTDFDTLAPGSQLRLDKNRGGDWAAGEYGVVTNIADDKQGTCSGFEGIDQLECLLAIDTHDTTCDGKQVSFTGDPQQSVTLSAGGGSTVTVLRDAIDVNQGLNPRLGIFDPEAGSWQYSTEVSIDTNHTTGRPYQCDGEIAEVSAEVQGLPYADCFADNSCDTVSAQVPLEDLETYWSYAHGGQLPPVDFKGEPFETAYDVYLHEVATGLIDPEDNGGLGPRASCHQGKDAADTAANRRLFEIAVVDCTGLTEVEQTDIAVEEYITVFLTDAVENREAFTLDFDDLVDVTDDGIDNPIGMQGGDIIQSDSPVTFQGNPNYYDPYAAQGLKVYALANKRNNNGYNAPMLFDTQNGWSRDPDLKSSDMGNVIIIPENRNSGTPDDHARGGMLIFTFSEPTTIQQIVFFDGEEKDNKIRLYSNPVDLTNLASWTKADQFIAVNGAGDAVVDVPEIGDGKHRALEIENSAEYQAALTDGSVPEEGIRVMVYDMKGSGAIDEITFTNELTSPKDYDQMVVEFLDVIDAGDSEKLEYPVISN